MITRSELQQIFRYNKQTGIFTRRANGIVAGSSTTNGYIKIQVNKKYYLLHRIIWLYATGSFPKLQIDHINRNRSDNRLCNLREVTGSQNMCNRSLNLNKHGRRMYYCTRSASS